MPGYNVDMTVQDPDPTHEAAYTRILRVIRGNKAFIDAMVKARPADLAENWKLALIRENREIVTLRGLWKRSGVFRAYLRGKLTFHFGAEYTESLVRIFLS